MNMDIDSYLYIIITIVILIITALGRRKKKPAQQATGQTASQPADPEDQPVRDEPYEAAGTEEVTYDPFERLEQLFEPRKPTQIVEEVEAEEEEESATSRPKMDPNSEVKRIAEMEREREKRRREELEEEKAKAFRKHSDGDLTSGVQEKEEKITDLILFDDPEDIKKAIIYSEILKTRYI